jgi:hypothetical protein
MDERDRIIAQLLQRVSDLEAAFSRIPARFAAESTVTIGIYRCVTAGTLSAGSTVAATLYGSGRDVTIKDIILGSGQTITTGKTVYAAKVINDHPSGQLSLLGAKCDDVTG